MRVQGKIKDKTYSHFVQGGLPSFVGCRGYAVEIYEMNRQATLREVHKPMQLGRALYLIGRVHEMAITNNVELWTVLLDHNGDFVFEVSTKELKPL